MDDKLKVLFVYETIYQSIISDIFTFSCLLGSFFINYHYLGNSEIIVTFICLCFFIYAIGKGNSKVKEMTVKEALEYLTTNKAFHIDQKDSAEASPSGK